MAATEMIIFEITEDEGAESYSAITLGYGIHAQEDIVDEIRRIPRETEG